MSRQDTTLLIVGAGPTGLAVALSLVKNGFRDFIIVDEAAIRPQASRAMTIHAATLEALGSIDCAETLVNLGIKGKGIRLSDRTATFMGTDFSSLAPYTKYPYVLLIPQTTTEQVLEARLNDLGIKVLRSEKVVGLKSAESGDLEVTFESGNVVSARYVVGADGARSVIRQTAGVGFADPDGSLPDERLAQMILADVTFSSDSPHLPTDEVSGFAEGNKNFLIIPLPKDLESSEAIYRIGFNVPLSAGPPPSNPPTSYLQQYLDEQGPFHLSSNPSVNPQPIHIAKTIWATRFRTHAAIADKFLFRMGNDDNKHNRGIVLLVGDAAHIHAPAGGLGMNLGIRDAIFLGPVLAAHIASTADSLPGTDKRLEEFVSDRRERALSTIKLTKRIMGVASTVGSTPQLYNLSYWIIRLLARVPLIQRRVVWNLSGLGNR